jgi:hypothetical protein
VTNNQRLVDARDALEQAVKAAKKKQGIEEVIRKPGNAVVLSLVDAKHLLNWVRGFTHLTASPTPSRLKAQQEEFTVKLRWELEHRIANGEDPLRVRANIERRYKDKYKCTAERAERVLQDKTRLRQLYNDYGLEPPYKKEARRR